MTSTPHPRLSLAAALATVLMSLCLTPLIDGRRWLLAAWVVVAVVTGTGAALRTVVRWWPVVVAAQTAILGVMLTVLFARPQAVFGLLPGPAAISAFGALLTDGLEITREQGPPVSAGQGVVLMAVGGVGLVGLATDLIAVSLRRPALAGLPLLAVYCLPAALLSGGLGWPYFLVAGLGYLVLVAADSGDRIRSWGRVLSASGRRAGTPGTEGLGRGGRRLAAACLAVSAIVPSIVPGLGERLIGRHGAGIGDGDGQVIRVVNPILDLRRDLNSTSNDVVLRYRNPQRRPLLLRIVADTKFDGRTWSPSDAEVPGSNRVQEGLSQPPGLGSAVKRVEARAQVTVGPLAQTYLPLPYPTTQVTVPGEWLYDVSTLNVVAGNRRTTTRELQYTVDYLDLSPTAPQLRSATSPPFDVANAENVAVPKGTAKIAQLTRQIAGDGSNYDRAARLQRYFRSGSFSYSTTSPRGDNPADDGGLSSLADFLDRRSGYCVHFASAMTLMARILGIPARVAVGFLPGTPLADGTYEVRAKDAHAWPELYFDGVGWVRFEPTPSARVSTVPDYTIPPVETTTPTDSPSSTASNQPGRSAARPEPLDRGGAATATSTWDRVLGATPWRLVAALAVLLLLGLLPLAAAGVTRRRRWRRAVSQAEQAEAAWDELRQRLGDLGARWAAAWTPRALAGRVVQDHALGGTERAALGRLVSDLESARYARPSTAGGRPSGELRSDLRIIADGVSANSDRAARRRARWLPTSGVDALVAMARRVDVAADQAGRRVNDLGVQARRKVGSQR